MKHYKKILGFILLLPLVGCPPSTCEISPGWPIASEVFTTAQQQILPVALPADTPLLDPAQIALYAQYGYSDWIKGEGTNYGQVETLSYDKRTDLAPGYSGAPNAARLLSFFSLSDIHISDKESPAQPLLVGWSAKFGATGACSSAYSPAIVATTQVLDAAVQTINALNKQTPFDFGISLGDDVNNCQYNELRWFIDVMDGKFITPSSGAHDGSFSIDYQRPYKAAGLEKNIPWYQVIGNHDQFWMGSAYENAKTMEAHIGNTVINIANDPNPSSEGVNSHGAYMGVVDGSTPYGDVIKAGPEEDFAVPPTVVADENRRSLATFHSSSLNWMKEFFETTSQPAGHGFTQACIDSDFACYSFQPKSNVPLKIIVLDDTVKGESQPNYARAELDQARLDWLEAELQEGQDNNKLMIIAAHIPVYPQKTFEASLGNMSIFSSKSVVNDLGLLAILHGYPNLILWISGHRHMNVVTPLPYDTSVEGQGPENSFWEVETASLRDFPQQFRAFDIRRNADNTLSIFVTDVDPAVTGDSPAAKSRGYALASSRIFGATAATLAKTDSGAYNAELVKQLTPQMQNVIANSGTPLD